MSFHRNFKTWTNQVQARREWRITFRRVKFTTMLVLVQEQQAKLISKFACGVTYQDKISGVALHIVW
jgi:hypothetical protein